MSVRTLEGVVQDGQIRLPSDIRLPDNTKVYIVIPSQELTSVAQLTRPRLARPEQIADFALECVEEDANAAV